MKRRSIILKHDVYPYVGDLTFPQLTLEILEIKVFKRIIERGALSVAKRLKSDLNQIFKSARKKKLIQYNPIEDIELPKPQGGNFAAVTEEQDLAPMLNKIWNYSKLYTRCFTDHAGGVKNLCADLSATWGDSQAEKGIFLS